LFVLLLIMHALDALAGTGVFRDGSGLWIAAQLVMSGLANALALFGNPAFPSVQVPKAVTVLLVVGFNTLHGVVGFKVLAPGSRGWLICTVAMALLQTAAVLLGAPVGSPGKSGPTS
jgi:hypothetical protein